MVSLVWMQTGAGKYKPTSWGGGAGACKTAFKSRIVIKDKNDNVIPYEIEKGEYIWPTVEPGYKIHYVVETGADDKDPASDEFYFVMSTLNWPYLIRLMNEINTNATPEQKQVWESNEEAFMQYIEQKIDPAQLMLIISSRVDTSDRSGTYHGIIRVNEGWMSGPVQMALIYGYNDDARSSDASRIWTNIFEVGAWVAFAVSVIIACSATLGWGCLLGASIWTWGGTLFAIEMAELASLAYDQYTRGLTAQIGRNKYGCSFPDGAFIHIYSAVIQNQSVQPALLINVQAMEQNPVLVKKSQYSLINQRTILLLAMATGVFILISTWGSDENG